MLNMFKLDVNLHTFSLIWQEIYNDKQPTRLFFTLNLDFKKYEII